MRAKACPSLSGAVFASLPWLVSCTAGQPPNIIWVVADDLGYNDVPFTGTGSEVVTPHLDRLTRDGMILGKYYVNPICTPTRASFMTGRYPIHLGLQSGVITNPTPDALPINETTVAEVLYGAGYDTYIIGKWHLGFHQPRYTPERRGFQHHFGYYTGNAEYWNHTSPAWHCGNYTGLDFHRSNATHFRPVTTMSDSYSTHIFANETVSIIHDHAGSTARPFFIYLSFEAVHGAASCYREGAPPDCANPDDAEWQAPQSYIDSQVAAGITDSVRSVFAAMVGALDEAVGNITRALEDSGLAQATLLIFTTDNGGPNAHGGGHATSNYPLRGGKSTLFEGGVRGASFIYSASTALLPEPSRGTRSMALMHCTDWFPTLAGLAGARLSPAVAQALDGVDMWAALVGASDDSPRSEMLHNIDPATGCASVRVGSYKYIVSNLADWGPDPRSFSGLPPGECPHRDICPGWQHRPESRAGSRSEHGIGASDELYEMLFNIDEDPQERTNLINSTAPADLAGRRACRGRLEEYRGSMVPIRDVEPDELARPTPVPGLEVCTPSPVGPILCMDVGVWGPWQADPQPGPAQTPAALRVPSGGGRELVI